MQLFSVILLLNFLVHGTLGLPQVIKVGGLFGADEEEEELVFKFAVDRINTDPNLLPRSTLVAQVERISAGDSFHTDKKTCNLLRLGVAAIFGPLAGTTSMHVQSICDALDLPHIETRWDFQANRNDLSLNLYPRPAILAKAYTDLVKAWNWRSFAVAYEDNEGIIRVQEFFKEAQMHNWKVKLYQFKPGEPYRDTFWRIKASGEKNIVLDVKLENMHMVLKHAQQVGMMTESHSYLITSLDLHTINMDDYKFGKTRITSYRLVDMESHELLSLIEDWARLGSRIGKTNVKPPTSIKTETALIYDAVKLFATAIQDLDQSQAVDIPATSCEHVVPWQHGSSLINYMRPINFRGVTGVVGFDQLGYRAGFSLDVMAISEKGQEKIGTWTEDKSLNISEPWMRQYSTLSFRNVTLIITTVLTHPYTMLREASVKKSGNDQFEGFSVDLVQELSKILHFRYKFKLVDDRAYGIKNTRGEWNGMIGELISGKADLAIADLTITSAREEAVDFTLPFMNTGISILFKKPTTKVTTLFSFLSPFSMVVWVYVLAAYIGVSAILFTVGRLSPYEWDNPHPCRQDDRVLENSFSLLNSFWFTIGSLMQQGSDLAPKAMSTRTIAGIWYFFTLIMISSYTANLAAFLTVEKVVYPIEGAEDLSKQIEIEYGCLVSGSTKAFFQESNIPVYKKMWEYMSTHEGVFVKSNSEGVARVEKGNYAYLMESASIEYIVERQCNLTQIGGLLDNKGYGIATRKDSPYRTPLSQAILQLQESGTLHTLKDRWWKQKRGGGQCSDDSKKGGQVTELSLANVGGVFVVLLGGLGLSFLVAICEFMWRARKTTTDRDSMCEEMMRDLKFALSCQSTTKPTSKTPAGDSSVKGGGTGSAAGGTGGGRSGSGSGYGPANMAGSGSAGLGEKNGQLPPHFSTIY